MHENVIDVEGGKRRMRKIPRVVKVWLFAYGLLLGSLIGGFFVLMKVLMPLLLVVWFLSNAGVMIFLVLIELRYKIVLHLWLPELMKGIPILKPFRTIWSWLRKGIGACLHRGS